jgi:hypothetical protein
MSDSLSGNEPAMPHQATMLNGLRWERVILKHFYSNVRETPGTLASSHRTGVGIRYARQPNRA